jgi:glyoxylase-like metal-dependent hydrolase (beta-lactamase superfamily II)
MLDYRVISIGTLSSHPLWQEPPAVRTPHATTTLIRSTDKVLLVDPGLPPSALAARLHERSGLAPRAVTDVFLTSFRPAHRAGLKLFDHARWWIAEAEREAIGTHLVGQLDRTGDEQMRQMIEDEITLLHRCKAAPDRLLPQVDLFPLPGYTPGTCGLLLSLTSDTLVIASDAVATAEHLERGQILPGAFDVEQAMESFKEVVEIADWIIPGHDNLTPNLTRRGS